MSIRLRLLLSYIAMILIPLVIFVLFSALLFTIFFKDIKGLGENSSGDGSKTWYQSVRDTFDKRNELMTGLKFIAENDPDRLADHGFLTKIDEPLTRLRAGFVVVTADHVTYASSLVDSVDLYEKLQQLETNRSGQKLNNEFMVDQRDFIFSSHQSGTLILLTDSTQFIVFVERFFPAVVLSLLVAIGLTNGLLTYLVSRRIIKPLYALKRAAEHIQQGDLDHELEVKSKDEIGELGAAFEEMRGRLKESIMIQLQYEENRKELISNISHDLKTPITGIKACVEGIFDGIANTDEMRADYLKMIYKKATDMDHLIEELFLFSKLDLKRVPFHMVSFDLWDYLRDFVDELRLDPRLQGISISFPFEDGDPVQVIADKEKLYRVLMNIVDNSLKHMDKEPKQMGIELSVGTEDVTVSLCDNGAGIEQEALPHIFDRFYRGERSRSTATGSSGLGLAIVKQIVEAHSGKVWASSEIGEGTCISFTLRKKAGSDGERE
ncbi:sensor histidine kinase [Paenibacillus sp. HJGM_3]|uniref:sensor histidine kinase n=1 Tax=Paenibacillus sp. HJGM_3 TaxID=3379816 RepID=UPI00385BB499